MKAGLLGCGSRRRRPGRVAGRLRWLRLEVPNALGLHARPAARVVETAGRFDAAVQIVDQTTGRGPADARQPHRRGDVERPDPGTRSSWCARQRPAGGRGARGPARARGRQLRRRERAGPGPPQAVHRRRRLRVPPRHSAECRRRRASPSALPGCRPPPRRSRPTTLPPGTRRPSGRGSTPHAPPRGRTWEGRRGRGSPSRRGRPRRRSSTPTWSLLDDAALVYPARKAIDDGRSGAAAWAAAAEEAASAYRGLDYPHPARARGRRRRRGRPRAAPPGRRGRVHRHHPLARASSSRATSPRATRRRWTARSSRAWRSRMAARPRTPRSSPAPWGSRPSSGWVKGILGIEDGTALVLDGQAGTLKIEPAADVVAEREAAREAGERRRAEARAHAREPATTTDGHTLKIAANLGSPRRPPRRSSSAPRASACCAPSSCSLGRDTLPDAEEQARAYPGDRRRVGGGPIVIRTLDAGADKPLPALASYTSQLGGESRAGRARRAARLRCRPTARYAAGGHPRWPPRAPGSWW